MRDTPAHRRMAHYRRRNFLFHAVRILSHRASLRLFLSQNEDIPGTGWVSIVQNLDVRLTSLAGRTNFCTTCLSRRELCFQLTRGAYAPWLATGSLSSGEPRGYVPSVAGRGFMPRPRKGGREADEIGRPSEGGRRSGSPSELTCLLDLDNL